MPAVLQDVTGWCWLELLVFLCSCPMPGGLYHGLVDGCLEEVHMEYRCAVKKAILDYALKSPSEQQRCEARPATATRKGWLLH